MVDVKLMRRLMAELPLLSCTIADASATVSLIPEDFESRFTYRSIEASRPVKVATDTPARVICATSVEADKNPEVAAPDVLKAAATTWLALLLKVTAATPADTICPLKMDMPTLATEATPLEDNAALNIDCPASETAATPLEVSAPDKVTLELLENTGSVNPAAFNAALNIEFPTWETVPMPFDDSAALTIDWPTAETAATPLEDNAPLSIALPTSEAAPVPGLVNAADMMMAPAKVAAATPLDDTAPAAVAAPTIEVEAAPDDDSVPFVGLLPVAGLKPTRMPAMVGVETCAGQVMDSVVAVAVFLRACAPVEPLAAACTVLP